MELLYLKFLSNLNTIIVRNKSEFNDLKRVMNKLGLGKYFDRFGNYEECKHLFEINGRHEDYMIFEHSYKGFTFGYDIQSSKDWYGEDPIECKKLIEEFDKVVK